MGLDKLFPGSQVNGGIVIAIVMAVLVYILMSKTTLGYELKACGANRHAARYAGIADRRNIVLSMAIAGCSGRCGGGPLLPLRQHGVLLVYLPVPARHRFQRHPRGTAGGEQSHRRDLHRLLHVHAGHLRACS